MADFIRQVAVGSGISGVLAFLFGGLVVAGEVKSWFFTWRVVHLGPLLAIRFSVPFTAELYAIFLLGPLLAVGAHLVFATAWTRRLSAIGFVLWFFAGWIVVTYGN